MGPNGSGKSTLVARAHGPRRLRGHRAARSRSTARSCSGCRRGSAPQPGCSSRCSTRSRCPACRVEDLLDAASMRGRDGDAGGLHDAVARRGRPRSASRDEFLDRGVNVEFSGGEQKRAETLQLAVLAAEVRDPRRDRLRPRRRRAARRVPPHRGDDRRRRASACSRSRTTRGCSPSCGPTSCTCFMAGRIVTSGGPELADELEETGYEGIAADARGRGRRRSTRGPRIRSRIRSVSEPRARRWLRR